MKKIFGNITKTSLTEKLYIPLFLILVTGAAGHWIGRSLQAEKFKKEKLFELKMEALKEGRVKATEIKIEARQIARRVVGLESERKKNWNSNDPITKKEVRNYNWDTEREDIIYLEGKLNDLIGISKIVDSDSIIHSSAHNSIKTIGGLLSCLNKRPNSHNCSIEFKDSIFIKFERLESSFNYVIQEIVSSEDVK